ncbi:cytochrome P450 [Streptomyces globisporus]|uniref:cytochrome P450 n=2 Tax=Streptomyces TaxID=1883 RepID=UPI000998572D|nr:MULTISPECIES: cytochrome P450 [unclassified Streptomyces]MYX04253.1 cytochrome P450 [Streptomyces sp. SID8378]
MRYQVSWSRAAHSTEKMVFLGSRKTAACGDHVVEDAAEFGCRALEPDVPGGKDHPAETAPGVEELGDEPAQDDREDPVDLGEDVGVCACGEEGIHDALQHERPHLVGHPQVVPALPGVDGRVGARLMVSAQPAICSWWKAGCTETELAGKHLPAKTPIIYSPYLMHHRADLFPEPEQFNPDRWLPENAVSIHRHSFIPFASGGRKCIGDTFGITESVLALASIIGRWDVRLTDTSSVRPELRATLKPRTFYLQLRSASEA